MSQIPNLSDSHCDMDTENVVKDGGVIIADSESVKDGLEGHKQLEEEEKIASMDDVVDSDCQLTTVTQPQQNKSQCDDALLPSSEGDTCNKATEPSTNSEHEMTAKLASPDEVEKGK